MAATFSVIAQAELSTGVWTDLSDDVNLAEGVHLRYGIEGNGPMDSVADTGECLLVLRNDAGNSGATQGWYSPNHASVRSGWTFGVPLRIVFTRAADSAKAITSITRVGATATVTTTAAHGWTTDDWATIAGAVQTEYNGVFKITVTGLDTFTYAVAGTPATPATGTITATRAYVKHYGKIGVIDPEAGRYLTQRCFVVSYDIMRDLAENDIREIGIQINKTESELVTNILAALPSGAQPIDTDIDTGVDTYPYALDNLGAGTKALTSIAEVARSAFALVACKGDGTFIVRSRHTRTTGSPLYTFNDTMHGLDVPSSLATVYNVVRATIHPKNLGATCTSVLYELAGTVPSVSAGDTLTLWGSYNDAANAQKLIGGTDFANPLSSGTDYQGNAAADGSGADLTGDLSITVTPFASAAKFEVQNIGASTVYLTTTTTDPIEPHLQLRGRGIYDQGPQTYEAESAQSYGVRTLHLDMPFQDDPAIGQSAAEYVEATFNGLARQINQMVLVASESDALTLAALQGEVGDRLTVTETLTGTTAIDAIIHSVELDITPGPWLVCRWGLAPVSAFAFWQIGTVGSSEIGVTTRVGF